MEFREMRYLMEIEHSKSMNRAADNLHISSPALHKVLHKLENEYSAKFFYREGRSLFPTEIGDIILRNAKDIHKIIKKMENEILASKELRTGEVLLGFPSVVGSIYLPDMIINFQQKYPGIILNTIEMGGDDLLNKVREGEIDAAIVMGPVFYDGINEIPIISDETVVCVHRQHPWAYKNHVTIRDFHDMPFVTFKEGFNLHKLLIEKFKEAEIHPHFALTGIDSHFLYRYAIRANQILILPKPMINLVCGADPIHLISFQPKFPWDLHLVYRKGAYLSAAAQALISHIQTFFFSVNK